MFFPPQSDEYTSWAAGCRMIMKGRPLAKIGYEQELVSIRGFIAMQNKVDSGPPTAASAVKVSCTVYNKWREREI